MPLIVWSDNLSVGVKQFDDQHKVLIDLINQLHEAMSQGKAQKELDVILEKLIDYTRVHFSNEEKVMGQYAYQRLPIQKTAHINLTERVVDFQKQLQAGKVGLSIQVSNFLKEWLTEHILKEDKQYSAFFKQKGVV